MNLFSIILKLIKVLNLSDSDEYQTLHNDVKKWELEKAKPDSDDTLGRYYHKLHQGVWARLIFPFVYFYLLGWVKGIMNPPQEQEDF